LFLERVSLTVKKKYWVIGIVVLLILIDGYWILSETPRETSKEFTIGRDEEAKIVYEFYLSTGVYKKHEYTVYLIGIDSISKSVKLNAIELYDDDFISCISKGMFYDISLDEKFICKVTEEGGTHFKLIGVDDTKATFETWFQIGEPHPEGPFQPKEIIKYSLCSQGNSSLCDISCKSDDDCILTCGCGCISKSEECRFAGMLCEAPGPYEECQCINNKCKYFNLPPS